MGAIGFDNQKYLTTQSEQIKKRIHQFGGKLYLEFGGKLFGKLLLAGFVDAIVQRGAGSCLTTIMPPGYCRALHRTARSGCFSS